MSTEMDEKKAKTEKTTTIGNDGDLQSLGLIEADEAATRSRLYGLAGERRGGEGGGGGGAER